MHLLNNVQDLQTKSSVMLDKLETEWSLFNTKLPSTVEEACRTVDCIQVCCSYCCIVIFLALCHVHVLCGPFFVVNVFTLIYVM